MNLGELAPCTHNEKHDDKHAHDREADEAWTTKAALDVTFTPEPHLLVESAVARLQTQGMSLGLARGIIS